VDAEVLVDSYGDTKVVTLNRPKALNSLNLDMTELMLPKYKTWQRDDTKLIIMKGSGDKAFCAGGDIRAVYDDGQKQRSEKIAPTKDNITHRFFEREYQLDYLIATLGKPHLSLLNGITMGGGVGLSVHGQYRLAKENTMFAMPETGIGFFCDVGGSYFLPRVPLGFEFGLYLALTGNRLKGADVCRGGVATHYVKPEAFTAFETGQVSHKNVDEQLERYRAPLGSEADSELLKYEQGIRKCFSAARSSVEDIFIALQKHNSDWSKNTLATLSKMSPTSLKVVFKQLHEGRKKNLADCFKMELRISQAFMAENDFFEGVRAVLVDKDKNPKWKPESLDKVSDAFVDKFFLALGDRELVLS